MKELVKKIRTIGHSAKNLDNNRVETHIIWTTIDEWGKIIVYKDISLGIFCYMGGGKSDEFALLVAAEYLRSGEKKITQERDNIDVFLNIKPFYTTYRGKEGASHTEIFNILSENHINDSDSSSILVEKHEDSPSYYMGRPDYE